MKKIIVGNTIIDLKDVSFLSIDEELKGCALIKILFKNISTIFYIRCTEPKLIEKLKQKILKIK